MAKPNNSSEIVGFRCAPPNLLVAEMMIKARGYLKIDLHARKPVRAEQLCFH
jgi:hypothetical protein